MFRRLSKYSLNDIEAFKDLSYVDLATKILADFLDFSKDEINGFCKAAYSRFETDDVCPVKKSTNPLIYWNCSTARRLRLRTLR